MLDVTGSDLGLQAQQEVIVHGSWHRGHLELQFLAFPQPNEAGASPGWSSPRGHQAFHHIEHLREDEAMGGGSGKAPPHLPQPVPKPQLSD